LKKPPSSYLRRFTYDTISHAPEPLRYLINLVGADRVMLGSDYCFDMGYERPVKVVTSLKLSRTDQEKILGGNAARLLRLR
jgi:aminocarboxymuconate-semialdehyde decarboxylase